MANPKNASFGLVPSAAVKALPAEDRKLFLRSTSHESFAGKRPAIARSCLKCCSQSLGEIHKIGQQRTQHAGIQLKTAELHNRNMCEYTFSYKENPLLGAESFRDGNRSTKPPLRIPLGTSTYLEAFGGVPSRRDMRHARKRLFEPPADRRLGSKMFPQKRRFALRPTCAGQKILWVLGPQRVLRRGRCHTRVMETFPRT
eukprot:symbB.v1.2.026733.t1/scaffold2694.1/size91562/9